DVRERREELPLLLARRTVLGDLGDVEVDPAELPTDRRCQRAREDADVDRMTHGLARGDVEVHSVDEDVYALSLTHVRTGRGATPTVRERRGPPHGRHWKARKASHPAGRRTSGRVEKRGDAVALALAPPQ